MYLWIIPSNLSLIIHGLCRTWIWSLVLAWPIMQVVYTCCICKLSFDASIAKIQSVQQWHPSGVLQCGPSRLSLATPQSNWTSCDLVSMVHLDCQRMPPSWASLWCGCFLSGPATPTGEMKGQPNSCSSYMSGDRNLLHVVVDMRSRVSFCVPDPIVLEGFRWFCESAQPTCNYS